MTERTNPETYTVEQLREAPDDRITTDQMADWKIRRIVITAAHDSEIEAGMAYSSYEHRHEAPNKIGVFRSGDPLEGISSDTLDAHQ